jgi:hypothetical protein
MNIRLSRSAALREMGAALSAPAIRAQDNYPARPVRLLGPAGMQSEIVGTVNASMGVTLRDETTHSA